MHDCRRRFLSRGGKSWFSTDGTYNLDGLLFTRQKSASRNSNIRGTGIWKHCFRCVHTVLAKHSKFFSLIDCVSVGVDRKQRNFEPMREPVEAWQRSELTDPDAFTRFAPLLKASSTSACPIPRLARLPELLCLRLSYTLLP